MRALSVCLGSLAVSLGLLSGCGLKGGGLSSEGQAITDDASEASDSVDIANGLSSIPSLAMAEKSMTLADAVSAQKNVGQFVEPAGCLTSSTSGNVVTYTFDGCTGPWGKVKLDGDEAATFSPGDSPGAVVIDMLSKNLTANGRDLHHEAHAVVSFAGGKRVVDWSGEYDGTTAKGRAVHHESELTWSVPVDGTKGCSTLDGQTDTQIGLRGLGIDYQSIQRCGPVGTCPDGTVVATGDKSHYTVTVTFDGTNVAQATGPHGGELDLHLGCTVPTESE